MVTGGSMAENFVKLRHFRNKSSYSFFRRSLQVHRICSSNSKISNDMATSGSKSIMQCFLNQHVQQILKKITGLDLEKIFRPVQHKLVSPRYKFVTDEQLQMLREEAHEKALGKLEMPPVMDERKPIDEIISKNPELQGYLKYNLVFTDISPSTNDKNRTIVVREPNGILREATWDERFRMNQVYFPMPGRKMTPPEMFHGEYLTALLDKESYVFVLDRACIQYEPNDPEYIKITHTTFDHINKSKNFDILRSTRHFGPMAFYFAYNNKVENLMVDMLERELLSDAADLVRLVDILQSENLDVDLKYEENNLDTVRNFISRNCSVQKPNLELAFQTYCEVRKNNEKNKTELKEAVA